MPGVAVLDANVLLPIALADIFLSLADEGLYRPVWTERILTETADAARRIGRGDITKRLQWMKIYFPRAMVHGWEEVPEKIDLPDPDDWHVLAAAIVGDADVIVTNNRKDFPPSRMPPGLSIVGPDEFLLELFEREERLVHQVLEAMVARTRRPPIIMDYLLRSLELSGAPRFSAAVRDYRGDLPT